jgi:hypothetical protein
MSAVKVLRGRSNRWFVRSGGEQRLSVTHSAVDSKFRAGSSVRGLSMINSSSVGKVIFLQWHFRACSIDAVVKGVSNGFPSLVLKRGPLTEGITRPRGDWSCGGIQGSPADLILSPGDFGFRTRQVSQNVSNQVNLRSYRLVFPIAFETEKWPRWLHLIA